MIRLQASLSLVCPRPGKLLLAICAVSTAMPAQPPPLPPGTQPLRLGFSTHLFSGLNETDVQAALRTLTAIISREKNIPADPNPFITQTMGEAEEVLSTRSVDAFGMTMTEFWLLRKKASFDRFLFTISQESAQDSYLLLVRQNSANKSLKDLQGKKINIQAGVRTYLAFPWLDLELHKLDLPDIHHFFGSIAEPIKSTKAALPVFFSQADACLITQRSYEILTEMNPQIGRELRTIAHSPAYVSVVIAFRSDLSAAMKETVIYECLRLHTNNYGQQGLMLIQTQQLVEHPLAFTAASLSLIDEYSTRCPDASSQYFAKFQRTRNPPVAATP